MSNIKNLLLIILGVSAVSCQGIVEGINDNPNKVTIETVDPIFFLKGAQLANISNQVGHLQRISAAWTGQLIGYQNLYKNLYEYNISTAEANGTWGQTYVGVITQVRHIRNQMPDDDLLQGICKVIEAHAIGSLAAIFGDVPYSEINDEEISDPVFDSQTAVFAALQNLLDGAIVDLGNAPAGRLVPEDIYYGGDKDKWTEAAWTLKARYYTLTKNYDQAFNAAQKGISSDTNSMLFKPQDTPNREDKNIFNTLLSGSRAGDIGNEGSYLLDLLTPGGADRNNAKTNEAARLRYLTIDESNALSNQGVVGPLEPQPLVTYSENILTLAEAGARTQGFEMGLQYLNEWRAFLASGNAFKILNANDALQYDDYTAADFQSGGIENPDGIDPTRALLREIAEERYIAFFGSFLPFNDARRLRKEEDVSVKFPFNIPTASQHPERFNYPQDEINANPNAIEPGEGIYFVVEVNR